MESILGSNSLNETELEHSNGILTANLCFTHNHKFTLHFSGAPFTGGNSLDTYNVIAATHGVGSL